MCFVLVTVRTHAAVVVMAPRVAIAWVVTPPFVVRPIPVTIPIPIVMYAYLDTGIDRYQPHLAIRGL